MKLVQEECGGARRVDCAKQESPHGRSVEVARTSLKEAHQCEEAQDSVLLTKAGEKHRWNLFSEEPNMLTMEL